MQEEEYFHPVCKDFKSITFSKIYMMKFSSMQLNGHQFNNIKFNVCFLWPFVDKYFFAV